MKPAKRPPSLAETPIDQPDGEPPPGPGWSLISREKALRLRAIFGPPWVPEPGGADGW